MTKLMILSLCSGLLALGMNLAEKPRDIFDINLILKNTLINFMLFFLIQHTKNTSHCNIDVQLQWKNAR